MTGALLSLTVSAWLFGMTLCWQRWYLARVRSRPRPAEPCRREIVYRDRVVERLVPLSLPVGCIGALPHDYAAGPARRCVRCLGLPPPGWLPGEVSGPGGRHLTAGERRRTACWDHVFTAESPACRICGQEPDLPDYRALFPP